MEDATFSVPFPAATGYRCPFVVVRFSGRLTLRYQTHYAARESIYVLGRLDSAGTINACAPLWASWRIKAEPHS